MRWIVLALMFFAYVINYADKAIIGYAADPLMKELGLNSAQWGMVGSSFYWLFAIAALLGGTWSDRIGTSKMIVVLLLAWTVLQFGSYAIMTLPMLILYRLLLGAFEGPFGPVVMSHAAKWFPPEKRGIAFAVIVSGASVGGIISAPILVAMIEKYGWRLTFALLGVVSLVLAFIWLFVDRKNKNHPSNQMALSKVKKLRWADISPVLRNPACFLTLALAFSAFWLSTWLLIWLPLYLTKVLHLEAMNMAYAVAGSGVAATVMVLVLSSFSDHLYKKSKSDFKSRVLVSGIVTLIGGLSLAFMPVFDSFIWIFVALCLAKTSSYSIAAVGPQILIKLMPERAGFMTSIYSFITNIASIVAPLITGILVQAAGNNFVLGFHYSLYVIVGLFIVTGILFLVFVRPDQPSKDIPLQVESV
ncbi:MFS transporter [Brevibacillus sp. HB1.2]|uniref:MFS transporter n=1 Tax=Brevibacillus TaxID=55080 RepID=UPI00156B8A40|nr:MULTISPECIES: MFS transporter [unclassified Brevibacillus]NRS15368.1 MFS transporter [Brevibacillus sp. HB1.4B]NTU18976.1 MFS transporter [Brevibacillus sp. HB1.2]